MHISQTRYFLTGLVFVVMGFVMKAFYRPYAYAEDLEDVGLADSAPSLLYVVGFSLLLSVYRRFKPFYFIGFVTFASVLYEFYQFSRNGRLDQPDILFSLFGGLLAFGIHRFLQAKGGK